MLNYVIQMQIESRCVQALYSTILAFTILSQISNILLISSLICNLAYILMLIYLFGLRYHYLI
jgi:hypothetical protein